MLLVAWLGAMLLAAAAGAWALVAKFPEVYGTGAGRHRLVRAGLIAAMVLAGLILLAGLALVVLIPILGARPPGAN
jgi:uncharacterized BrkB/YihY/UPF0761 family membrane protein